MSGKIFVVSGPSGVGKGTIIDLARPHLKNFKQLATVTTRKPRKNGRKEKDRKFISRQKFREMIKNQEFLEYNFYNGNYYGTPKKEVTKILNQGKNILLEIDVNGGKKIKEQCHNQAVLIFIWANINEIKHRLIIRGQNTKEEIKERLKRARIELKNKRYYDYEIYNQEGKPHQAALKLVKICNQ